MMEFQHSHASHCESGVMSSMLRHYGLPLSEAMSFGLSSALSFAYLPLIKINGLPLVSYRMPPKFIIKGLQKPLGFKMRFETFRSPAAGVVRLNELLDAGQLVGLQTSVFWLPYLPPDLRFHFNAHNILAYGRDAASGDYLLSDPVAETTVTCPAADLQRARFAKGVLAPKGLLYYPLSRPQAPDWGKALPAAIKKTTRIMLDAPLPIMASAASGAWPGRLANSIAAARRPKASCSSARSCACRKKLAQAGVVSVSSTPVSCKKRPNCWPSRLSMNCPTLWLISAMNGANSPWPPHA